MVNISVYCVYIRYIFWIIFLKYFEYNLLFFWIESTSYEKILKLKEKGLSKLCLCSVDEVKENGKKIDYKYIYNKKPRT